MIRANLAKQRFGMLLVLHPVSATRSGMTRWSCKCDCGNVTDAASKNLIRGATKSCGCARKRRRGKYHAQWTGAGELSGNAWYNIKRHSMARGGVPINISVGYAWRLFLSQKRRCALSGVTIYFGDGLEKTASLDRINSSKGYVRGNVQWVHKDVNKMKNTFEQNYFIRMCFAIGKIKNYMPEKVPNA